MIAKRGKRQNGEDSQASIRWRKAPLNRFESGPTSSEFDLARPGGGAAAITACESNRSEPDQREALRTPLIARMNKLANQGTPEAPRSILQTLESC